MNVNTYDATPILDQVINVTKDPGFQGRIFRDDCGEGFDWYELGPDEFVLGHSAREAAEWKASRPGYGYASLAQLKQTYEHGQIISLA